MPVYEGELQARALGATVESWSEDGEPLIGEVGELVVTEPMPSMPLFFWNDEDGERYRESYFEMFPGVWRHGDWIEITERGTAIISGRSDSTINRGGIRMGTAEIYRAVLALDEVDRRAGRRHPEGGRGELHAAVRGAARRRGARRGPHEGDPHAHPRGLLARGTCRTTSCAVKEVPRTLSGKVLELPVKKILQGADPDKAASRDSLANPEALDFFVDYASRG